MGLGALTLAWIAVEAALPLAWKFMSLVRGEDDEWTATARGPEPSDVEVGHGGDETAALRRLAEALQRRRGTPGSG